MKDISYKNNDFLVNQLLLLGSCSLCLVVSQFLFSGSLPIRTSGGCLPNVFSPEQSVHHCTGNSEKHISKFSDLIKGLRGLIEAE